MSRKSLSYYKALEYNVIIQKEELDGEKWYVAYCNELGLNACHGIGVTLEEALKSFLQEKNYFIEFLYEKGEPIPEVEEKKDEQCSGVFTVRTTPLLHAMLIKQAKMNDVSLNSYITHVLSFFAGGMNAFSNFEKRTEVFYSEMKGQMNTVLESVNKITYDKKEIGKGCVLPKNTEVNNNYLKVV